LPGASFLRLLDVSDTKALAAAGAGESALLCAAVA
jgi:hypothetical protein